MKVFSLGDQGNSSKVRRYEWKMSEFEGTGAAEVDDLLGVPATG